jgi:class 3 adenylate cyclase
MENKYAIMFADVAGSTNLYDTLGNEIAEKRIAECINIMSNITSDNQGRVIKTIGDEIMACFNTSNDAANAALEMQNAMENSDVGLSIRVGIHYGEAIDKDGDIYGDAVNVAARMAGIAKAKQIITTEDLVKGLNTDLAEKSRLFDTAKVKGKDEEIKIFQINWEEASKVTKFATAHDIKKISSSTVAIALKFAGEERLYTDEDIKKAVSIGRDKSNDIAVEAGYASRSHVDMDFRRGKFVLIDHSTNGTYVRFKGQDDIFIRREELPLMGEGVINLGEAITDDSPGQISFNILQPSAG